MGVIPWYEGGEQGGYRNSMDDYTDIIIEKKQTRTGVVLNRPKALNALSFQMIEKMTRLLSQDHGPIVFSGAGDRAFCAGGDIKSVALQSKSLREAGAPGDAPFESILDYFRAEYAMNRLLAARTGRLVALMDGIVMGGGFGVAAPCGIRVATERTKWAMPEVSIGFFPDVGSIYYMNRFPGGQGLRCALTGMTVDSPAELLRLGIATHFVPAEKIGDLRHALLTSSEDAAAIVDDFAAAPGPAEAPPPFPEAGDMKLPAFLEQLAGSADLAVIRTRSPFSVAVTYEYMRWGRGCDLADVLHQDLYLSGHFLEYPDFYEGVRAQVIDKDKNPRWQNALAEDVDANLVRNLFMSS